jgi:hypothetical protein
MHPAHRIAAGLCAIAAAGALIVPHFPKYLAAEAVVAVCVAFVSQFLVIFAAVRSRPASVGGALVGMFLAMLVLLFIYADIYLASGLVVDASATPLASRSDALYFSIVTWTTLGYGDLVPTGICRLVAASEALVGNIYLGIFIALGFYFISDARKNSDAQAPCPGSVPN